jgi:hypothetical protein
MRTVDYLRMPEMNRATQLWEMVEELASLRDGVLQGYVPYGLLQFLVRLSNDESLKVKEPIDQWLQEHAKKKQDQQLCDINVRLQEETQHKVLIILVQNDEKGEVTKFSRYLRNSNFSPVNGANLLARTVKAGIGEQKNWEDFELKLQELLDQLDKKQWLHDIEVHFLVDPPLFDRPFHQIPVKQGPALGEKHVVLLRHRGRILCSTQDVRRAWEAYADELRRAHQTRLFCSPLTRGRLACPATKAFVLPVLPFHPAQKTAKRKRRFCCVYWTTVFPSCIGFIACPQGRTKKQSSNIWVRHYPGFVRSPRFQASCGWNDSAGNHTRRRQRSSGTTLDFALIF